VGQEEGSLILIEIISSSEYELEDETNSGSTLSSHPFPPPTLLPPSSSSPSSFTTLPPLYTMSQHGTINYELLAQ